VRLAFAVAAHLETEILLVDEVLAVGDAAFQRKCLGKMRDLASSSTRTVIFVSHNMSAIESLCERVLFFERGEMVSSGRPGEVIARYFAGLGHEMHERVLTDAARPAGVGGDVRFTSARVTDATGRTMNAIRVGEELWVEMMYRVEKPIADLMLQVR